MNICTIYEALARSYEFNLWVRKL